MNEAARILASRGVITLRRGAKGGVFVAAAFLPITLSQSLLELNPGAKRVEDCWAVFKQLEPLVTIEATRRVSADAVTELKRESSILYYIMANFN